jgi:hypothetical protein
MCALYYDENYINKVINKLEEDLYPSLGKLSSYEIHEKEELIYSQICRIKLNYNETTKKVVLKKYLKRSNLNQVIAKPGSGEGEFNILKSLHSKLAQGKCLKVVTPIAYLSEEDLLITEEFEGTKFNEIIISQLRWFAIPSKRREIESYFFKSGQWLKWFQGETLKEDHIDFAPDKFIEDLSEIFKELTRLGCHISSEENIMNCVDKTVKRIGKSKMRLTGNHDDFSPTNILIGNGELAIMDFTRFSYDSNYEDLALFLVVVEGYKSTVGILSHKLKIMQRVFLEGYGKSDISQQLLRLYLLKNTLKVMVWTFLYPYKGDDWIDHFYAKFRKKRLINAYIRYLNELCQIER